MLLTTSGRVLLTCPEEPDGTVLMETSPHGSVGPLDWPGAVVIPTYGEKPEEARTRVLSLTNGTVVEFGYPTDDAQRGTEGARNSPWLVGPAPEDTADEQILDLRTMQTRLLSEIAGTSLPEHEGYLVSGDGPKARWCSGCSHTNRRMAMERHHGQRHARRPARRQRQPADGVVDFCPR